MARRSSSRCVGIQGLAEDESICFRLGMEAVLELVLMFPFIGDGEDGIGTSTDVFRLVAMMFMSVSVLSCAPDRLVGVRVTCW